MTGWHWMTVTLTHVSLYWEGGIPAGGNSCGHRCLCSPGSASQSHPHEPPNESSRSRSWYCETQNAQPLLLYSPTVIK